MVQPRDILGRFASPAPTGNNATSLRAREAALAEREILIAGQTGMTSAAQVFMRETLEVATVRVSEVIGLEVALFTKSLANKTRRNRDDRVRGIHDKAGELAQIATLNSFRRKHPRRGYSRSKSRMANGAMLKAIGSEGFYVARWDGVSFANKAVFDQTAKQWYRLNFGAGRAGRSSPTPGTYKIKFFDAVAGELSLKGFGPSAPFKMPKGVWINKSTGKFATGEKRKDGRVTVGGNVSGVARWQGGNSNNEFIAKIPSNLGVFDATVGPGQSFRTASPRVPTRGIVGTNYLDAGVRSLSINISSGWTALMREWFAEAANTGTGPIALAAKDLDFSNADIVAMNKRLAKYAGEMRATLAKFESPLR